MRAAAAAPVVSPPHPGPSLPPGFPLHPPPAPLGGAEVCGGGGTDERSRLLGAAGVSRPEGSGALRSRARPGDVRPPWPRGPGARVGGRGRGGTGGGGGAGVAEGGVPPPGGGGVRLAWHWEPT